MYTPKQQQILQDAKDLQAALERVSRCVTRIESDVNSATELSGMAKELGRFDAAAELAGFSLPSDPNKEIQEWELPRLRNHAADMNRAANAERFNCETIRTILNKKALFEALIEFWEAESSKHSATGTYALTIIAAHEQRKRDEESARQRKAAIMADAPATIEKLMARVADLENKLGEG